MANEYNETNLPYEVHTYCVSYQSKHIPFSIVCKKFKCNVYMCKDFNQICATLQYISH